jgi:phosphohistidine phosphatase
VDLYLVRHAPAFPKDPARWPDDSRRPLTPDGEQAFRRTAAAIGKLAPSVAVVLASPFPRACRTAEILHQEAGWPSPVASPEMEKGRRPEEAVRAVSRYRDRRSVAVVGHDPNLTELAWTLLTGGADGVAIELAKGGALRLTVQGELRPGSARLVWLLTPEALRPPTR